MERATGGVTHSCTCKSKSCRVVGARGGSSNNRRMMMMKTTTTRTPQGTFFLSKYMCNTTSTTTMIPKKGATVTHATRQEEKGETALQHKLMLTLMPQPHVDESNNICLATLFIVGMMLMVPGDSTAMATHEHILLTHHHDAPLADIAENEDFWANVLRYVSYFFSVLLGTAYVAFKPILELLKRPTTALLVIAGAAGLYYFVSTTVSMMLGVNEFTYEPSSIVTPYN